MTGNKGEWSEAYVLLKLLADGEIYAADSGLSEESSHSYPLVKVLRDGMVYTRKKGCVSISSQSSNELLAEISVSDFEKAADLLLERILSSDNAFDVPEISDFLENIGCRTLKAVSSDKADIRLVLHDRDTMGDVLFGFSIKSQLGGSSTLLNAGNTTNFIYETVGGMTESLAEEINALDDKSKIRSRISVIYESGCKLKFVAAENRTFSSNLQVVDSRLPDIIASMLVFFFSGAGGKISDLAEKLQQLNPIGYNTAENHPFYSYKLKSFLFDVALGMTPSTIWTGTLDATGGYIVVKPDGEPVCYHSYDRNRFSQYLFDNTKLETASTSRYGFGTVYSENGKYYIKLNLQVRFL